MLDNGEGTSTLAPECCSSLAESLVHTSDEQEMVTWYDYHVHRQPQLPVADLGPWLAHFYFPWNKWRHFVWSLCLRHRVCFLEEWQSPSPLLQGPFRSGDVPMPPTDTNTLQVLDLF